jgi:hypothetical protein
MANIPQHSSRSIEYYTPPEIVDVVHKVFCGPPDLDPASCREANKVVGAGMIYTEKVDGLAQCWFGNVYLNPPYGLMQTKPWWSRAKKVGRGYSAKEIWLEKLLREQISAAVVLVTASTGDAWFHRHIWAHAQAICFPRRVKYLVPGGAVARSQPGASVLAYFSPHGGIHFAEEAKRLGPVAIRNSTWDRRTQ